LNMIVRPEAVGSEIRITTLDGRLLDRMRVDRPTQQIDVGRYVDGMYTLTVQTSAGKSTQRFVIQH